MKVINLNKQQGLTTLLFPDNQPHVNIQNVSDNDDVTVICSIKSSLIMMNLLQVANALDNLFANKKELHIPYLMGARFDRLMQHGDSIDIKVIANLINSMNFEKVYLYDVHSDVSTMLINNAININNSKLVKEYNIPNSVLICPDAGAAKKIGKYLEWNSNFTDVVYCTKERDVSNGNLKLEVLKPDVCLYANCVIIDDLCDGGGTFLGIASQIKPASLTLIVTHGIFSKGTDILTKVFNEIIVSDSYYNLKRSTGIHVVNWF